MDLPESDYHEPTAWSKPNAKDGGGVNYSYVFNFKNVYRDMPWLLLISSVRFVPNFKSLSFYGSTEGI